MRRVCAIVAQFGQALATCLPPTRRDSLVWEAVPAVLNFGGGGTPNFVDIYGGLTVVYRTISGSALRNGAQEDAAESSHHCFLSYCKLASASLLIYLPRYWYHISRYLGIQYLSC